MRTRLNKREVAALNSVMERILKLRNQYDPEAGKDIELQIQGNGTVWGNLSCAAASLDTILQEY